MNENYVITIGRQYGCGGRTIGKLLSEKLGIKYLDDELIRMAAEKNGVSVEFYKEFDEKASSKFASIFGFATPMGGYYTPLYNDVIVNDKLYYTQTRIIKESANKGPCVIVGRCADYILEGQENLVTVFLHADLETRRDRIVNKYGIEDKNITKHISKADKRRSQYYNTYTDKVWGTAINYDIVLNTSKMSAEDVVALLCMYLEKLNVKG